MKKRIALLPGDGIGPEVLESATDVLKSVAERFNHEFEFEYGLIGGAAIDEHHNPSRRKPLLLVKMQTRYCLVLSADRNGIKILRN
ncbi:3-isopropylmalate dehydrogenase [Bacillus subtilis]|nr:3-isopropylmalate dehydrogenase [Bacillus subtilis]